MDWKNVIEEFLIRSIDLFAKYYMSGNLEKISVIIDIEEENAEIIIGAGGESEHVDFNLFRSASEGNERDAQRECYFENESLWMDFLIDLDRDSIEKCMSEVAIGLMERYGVDVDMQVESEE
ncbi:hypothetical protein [Clostridium sp. AN503]|uniref:hypothetical protein n=1 Tax=Clostridium sp. AN503 TaxID=3160598 RepID=UPI00345ACED9